MQPRSPGPAAVVPIRRFEADNVIPFQRPPAAPVALERAEPVPSIWDRLRALADLGERTAKARRARAQDRALAAAGRPPGQARVGPAGPVPFAWFER